ncbi:Uncharacterised protein [Enterobacter hormaechei]|nr:Uncharacterised protein [Enterobacter hormaechei]
MVCAATVSPASFTSTSSSAPSGRTGNVKPVRPLPARYTGSPGCACAVSAVSFAVKRVARAALSSACCCASAARRSACDCCCWSPPWLDGLRMPCTFMPSTSATSCAARVASQLFTFFTSSSPSPAPQELQKCAPRPSSSNRKRSLPPHAGHAVCFLGESGTSIFRPARTKGH